MVLTFAEPEAASPEFKPEAVRRLNNFLKWMQRELGYQFQHCKSWELQKSGRLHVNVIFDAPWDEWMPFKKLQAKWGARVTFQKVTDGKRLSGYATKVAGDVVGDDSLGRYVTKAGYQALPREWGRRVTYSRGWPKERRASKRLVDWKLCGPRTMDVFKLWALTGQLEHVKGGRWREAGTACGCFDHPKGSVVDHVFKTFPGAKIVEVQGGGSG